MKTWKRFAFALILAVVSNRAPVFAESEAPAATDDASKTTSESSAPDVAAAAPEADAEVPAAADAPAEEPKPVAQGEPPRQYAPPVEVHGGMTYATVNGVEIKGTDLALFGKDFMEKPQTMPSEMFEQLLTRAIENQLIRQQSEVEGVSLSDAQQGKLDALQAEVKARASAPWAGNVPMNGTMDEEAQFEKRDAESQMLAENLLAKRGVTAPNYDITEEEIETYFDGHKAEYKERLKNRKTREQERAAINFSIGREIAMGRLGVYNLERRKLVEELTGQAEVVRMPIAKD